jgi:hypothetical protein
MEEKLSGRPVRRALVEVDVLILRALPATRCALADAGVFICWVHVYLAALIWSRLLDLDVTSCACSPPKTALWMVLTKSG